MRACWATIPNLLTLLRIALIPVAILAILRSQWAQALAWVALASLTDFWDGFLARSRRWGSPLGAVLDPLADKLMVAAVFLTEGWVGLVPLWLVGLAIARDLLILAFALVSVVFTPVKLAAFTPSRWGKISTFLQMSLAAWVLIAALWPLASFRLIQLALVPAVALFTVLSGLHYGWTGWRMLRQARPSS